jgi:hypothetical protein
VNGIKDKLTQGLSDGIPNGVNSLTNRSGAWKSTRGVHGVIVM